MTTRTLCLCLALSAFCLATLSSPAWAARQYRCSGRVQFRPCNYPPSGPVTPGTKIGSVVSKSLPTPVLLPQAPPVTGEIYARVLEKSFLGPAPKQAPRRKGYVPTGVWKGLVEGNGMVHLFLEILRDDSVEERRFMGNVLLRDKSTTFAFVSPLPKGNNWSWRVAALAKK